MSLPLEYRRASAPGVTGRKLAGVAVRYGAIAELGRFRETIAPGAFSASLVEGGDILALADHDPSKVLARSRSKTLRLTDSADALLFELDVPDTAAGRDMLALAERGDLGGMSFGMIVEDEATENGVRVVKRAKLIEVTVVSAWPAYEATSVEARERQPGHKPPLRPRLAGLKRYLETV